MGQFLIMPGAHVRLYINNTIYTVTQDFSIDIDYGEYPIYGIDSPYAQELAGGGTISVRGSITGVRLKNGGGPQAHNARPLFSDVIGSNYVSIRLEDRTTGEVIYSIMNAKINAEKSSVSTKGTYKANLTFIGQIAYSPLDLS